MTDTRRPPACRYDRNLGERVTTEHRDDCTEPTGHRGCVPCTAPHCVVCGHEHATNDHPDTCPTCIGKIRDDLTDIQAAYTALAVEATDGGRDGHLVAAARIPGGTAQVLIGPTVRLDMMRVARNYRPEQMAEVHHVKDPIPPLAVLAQWEDIYRQWLSHTPARRASMAGALAYLDQQLDYLANHVTEHAPDWVTFTKQIRSLRANLERALHDEREPEVGVECFECGDRLVRRFRDPKRCRHTTPERAWFRQSLRLTDLGYPELGPKPEEVRATRVACGLCSQGGLDDPRAGRSWECPGCRKEYDPGEYATAMRRDLLENGDQGDGWTHVGMAAEAASTLVGTLVLEGTVRKWMDTGKVAGMCEWTVGRPWGQRFVFWPDVAARAVDSVARAQAAEARRRERVKVEERFWEAVGRGEKPRAVAKRLGIDKGWLARLLDKVAA